MSDMRSALELSDEEIVGFTDQEYWQVRSAVVVIHGLDPDVYWDVVQTEGHIVRPVVEKTLEALRGSKLKADILDYVPKIAFLDWVVKAPVITGHPHPYSKNLIERFKASNKDKEAGRVSKRLLSNLQRLTAILVLMKYGRTTSAKSPEAFFSTLYDEILQSGFLGPDGDKLSQDALENYYDAGFRALLDSWRTKGARLESWEVPEYLRKIPRMKDADE